MRLAGYDWVPETKLTRSLQESWQRGKPGRSQNICWLMSAACGVMLTCSVTTEIMTLTSWDSGGFGGQLLHI